MLESVRSQLLALRARDEQVRAELAEEGSLHEGYHPRMEEVHRDNTYQLRSIITEHGWPDVERVGDEGAEAAWLIAQHAIGEPDFMRLCRQLLDEASAAGRVPMWQFAYIDDRIRVFEGKPQRYGTQIDLRPEGPAAHELEDAARVEAWRKEVGLPPLATALSRAETSPRPTPGEYAAKESAGARWREEVGWMTQAPDDPNVHSNRSTGV